MSQKDLEALQGAWIVTSLEMEGQTTPPEMLKESQVVVQGNRFTSTGMGARYEGTLLADASKAPAHLDMHFEWGPEQGNTNLGIYEIHGDEWRLCIATRGVVRPQTFTSKPGSGIALETLVRSAASATVERGAATASGARAAGTATAAASEFEGEWRMVSAVFNGAPMEASMTQWVKRVFEGDQTTVIAGPQIMLKAVFSIDASQSPKVMDYQNLAGSHKGKAQLGIYEFDGDLLKICMAAPGAERPQQLESTKGDGRALTVWTR